MPSPSNKPIALDMIASSVAQSLLRAYNKKHGTRRRVPTKEEMSYAYATATRSLQKRKLLKPGTHTPTAAGRRAEEADAERFRPESKEWLENQLARQRAKTAKKRAKKKAVRNPHPGGTRYLRDNEIYLPPRQSSSLDDMYMDHMSSSGGGGYPVDAKYANDSRFRSSDFRRARPNPNPRRVKRAPVRQEMVQQESAPMSSFKHSSSELGGALKTAGGELARASWLGAKWTGERLWAGTKAVGRGVRKTAKVGAKYTAKGLDRSADWLEEYAARPNPFTCNWTGSIANPRRKPAKKTVKKSKSRRKGR